MVSETLLIHVKSGPNVPNPTKRKIYYYYQCVVTVIAALKIQKN